MRRVSHIRTVSYYFRDSLSQRNFPKSIIPWRCINFSTGSAANFQRPGRCCGPASRLLEFSPSLEIPRKSLSTSNFEAQKKDNDTSRPSAQSSDPVGINGKNGETVSRVVREVDDRSFPHFKEQEAVAMYGTKDDPFPEPGRLISKNIPQIGEETMPHPIWTNEQLESVRIAHKNPGGIVDWLAYISVQMSRLGFDILSGYTFGTLNEKNWLRRLIYLENIAGVPGMMGAMVRHLKSLRTMKRDYGWIHTLLEEAENERMHLMVVLEMKQPGPLFRFGVTASQGVYVNIFFVLYLISPRFCHRFVGYLEEEAVKTYTRLLEDIDAGRIPEWKDKPATGIAKRYWKLPDDATIRDMFAAIRADEAHHRLVNHTLGSMQPDQHNPFKAGR